MRADRRVGARFAARWVRTGLIAERLCDVSGLLRLDDLGPGWEGAARALADVQRDLSTTVAGAPSIKLLWHGLDEDGEGDEAGPAEVSLRRWAYVGKAADWYFGANGGFELPRGYADAAVEIATEWVCRDRAHRC